MVHRTALQWAQKPAFAHCKYFTLASCNVPGKILCLEKWAGLYTKWPYVRRRRKDGVFHKGECLEHEGLKGAIYGKVVSRKMCRALCRRASIAPSTAPRCVPPELLDLEHGRVFPQAELVLAEAVGRDELFVVARPLQGANLANTGHMPNKRCPVQAQKPKRKERQ